MSGDFYLCCYYNLLKKDTFTVSKALVYACLCGSAITDIVKDVGIQIGTKLTTSAINKISGATLTKINQAVGFRLVTKFGTQGSINLVKAVPFLGGIVGGTVDSVSTNTIEAVKVFRNQAIFVILETKNQ